MSTRGGRTRILLIDQQEVWRAPAAQALAAAGFSVSQTSDYNLSFETGEGGAPDLIVLGCAGIGPEERGVIQRAAEKDRRLLVLAASLSWEEMRSAFLAGADDATEKPYDPAHLVEIVHQTLETIAGRDEYSSALRRRAQ